MEVMSSSGLLSTATKNLSVENYGGAIPYLEEYLERMKDSKDSRVLTMKQKVRLKLGRLTAHLKDSLSAVKWFREYVEERPLYRPREAFKLLAVNLYENGEYVQCIDAVTNALAGPLQVGLLEKEKVVYEELSKEELGGLSAQKLARIEKKVAKAEEKEKRREKKKLSEGFSDDRPDVEPDYTVEEVVALQMLLADSHAALEQWQASLEPYQFAIEHTEVEDLKGYAIMQLVNSLIALEEFEKAKTFILQLARANTRFDIRVNMALISAAAALFNEAEYDSSLLLYRMVLPREDLLEYQEIKMNEIRRETGLPLVNVTIVTNDTGRVETLFGVANIDLSATITSDGQALPSKPMKLILLEEMAQTLASLPPYEDNVLYQTGRVYAEADRPWEAVTAFDLLAGRDLNRKVGLRAFAESLMVLVNPLKKYDLVEERGWRFLKTHWEGLVPRMVALALTSSYQEQEHWKEIKKLLPTIEKFVPSNGTGILRYECELYYMQAIADMVLLNYQAAKDGFEEVMVRFPDSHRQESSTYWHAMTRLFLKEHEKALAEFDAYSNTWPDGTWRPSVTFHSGICLFGMEKYEEAGKRFTQVIDSWPDCAVYPDACSLRGDLFASKGGEMLDLAQKDYEEAIATARLPRQATYAVFQMVAMFEQESRYDEIIDTVNAYLDQYDEKADVAKAAYWIGKIKLEQGLTVEALETYREAIVKYGGTVQQDGVDLIISELINISKTLEADERQVLKENLRTSLRETDQVPLQLRLRVLLAKMEGTSTELGHQLISELDDLTQAPPPVLAVICDASFEQKDYSRSEEILMIFQTRYEESDFMRTAFKLRGFGLFAAGEYDEVLKIAKEAQAIYGVDSDVVWAQMLKGRVELQNGDLDAARKTFRALLTVREWRGAAYAEATFYLGSVEETGGELRKAFGWYQRTYFQYKGYAKGYWAAEGYLASARCLQTLGLENDMRNTFRAMLFDKYVNHLPQAVEAKNALGADEVLEINTLLTQGTQTNITVVLEAEVPE